MSFGSTAFSAPMLVDGYLDARPTDRLRGFVLGRLTFDPTLDESAGGFSINPTPEQIDAAEICYLGGHVYEVDADEAESLTAAGYTVTYP